jgi:hypothetical protein
MDKALKKDSYDKHHKNIKLIEHSINLLQKNIKNTYIQEYEIEQSSKSLVLKKQIKEKFSLDRDAYLKILLGVITSWSEELIKRLLFENNAFKSEQIIKIHLLQDARQKWQMTFKVAFCNAFLTYSASDPLYKKISNPENEKKIKRSLRIKFLDTTDLIKDEIFPVIDLRNKVQHGEWLFAFEPPHSIKFDGPLTGKIRKENIRTIQTKINDIETLYKMIKDVATYNGTKDFKLGKKTNPYEYFFNQNYERIEFNKENLKNLTEKKYRQSLIEKYANGKIHKDKNEGHSFPKRLITFISTHLRQNQNKTSS